MDHREYAEANPLPAVCRDCQERIRCLAHGEGEWCCDECDHLGERFVRTSDTLHSREKSDRITKTSPEKEEIL